jgi:hypothetical protein
MRCVEQEKLVKLTTKNKVKGEGYLYLMEYSHDNLNIFSLLRVYSNIPGHIQTIL